MMAKSKLTDMTLLTIMSDIDDSTRNENGENAGVVKASGVCGAVVDLKAETKSMSTDVRHATRMIYHGTAKQCARASGISDDEGVLGEGVQDSTGVIEECEGLVTGVGNGCCDLQVLRSIDIDTGD